MKRIFAGAIFIACVLLVGCSRSLAPPSMPASVANSATAPNFRVLYDFRGHRDGALPFGSLIDVNGVLYGTTGSGGKQNGGTVFAIEPSGKERVVWSPGNGVGPSNLTTLHRTLYGTTRSTVFSLSVTGVERTLYNFGKDVNPSSLLISANRTFHGTTFQYGRDRPSSGSIFRIHSGVERVLYTFRGDSKGAYPISLLYLNATFYGITYEGGVNDDGTVFALSPTGALRVVHSFGGGNDGSGPGGGLIAIDGVLYGTTEGGGSGHHCSFPTGPPSSIGCGTIYSVTPSGKEHVLYNFQGGADSAFPRGNLIDVAGTLYGTAAGDPADTFYQVGGSVFSITPAGMFRVLHTFSFRSNKDGANPVAGLTELNGTLYGTTHDGGKYDRGIVFRLQP
ncbi:MAG: choice-of-anchor tandem repeat GloVer-containing protein [Candidatus Cybelea sp.]